MSDANLGLGVLSTALTTYLVPLAGASGLTLALQEAAKKLLSLRGRFHQRAVRRWLTEHAHNVPGRSAGAQLDPLALLHGDSQYNRPGVKALAPGVQPSADARRQVDERYQQFCALTTGLPATAFSVTDSAGWRFRSIDRAVFELETARMMSQVQDAADVVLNNPTAYEALYGFLTRGCDPGDADEWQRFLDDSRRGAALPAERQKLQADRYGRIRLATRRQLDAFQSVTQMRWDDLNQLWAVVLGAVILLLAQLVAMGAPAGNIAAAAAHPWTALKEGWDAITDVQAGVALGLSSLLGGALAPIAKDLVNAVANLKLGK